MWGAYFLVDGLGVGELMSRSLHVRNVYVVVDGLGVGSFWWRL